MHVVVAQAAVANARPGMDRPAEASGSPNPKLSDEDDAVRTPLWVVSTRSEAAVWLYAHRLL
jgi:hypothetical protein